MSEAITSEAIREAQRQLRICNACRYCEGYCAVFPALHVERDVDGADVLRIADLCHNCRGCHYACQYTEPHEFALNIPKALADVQEEAWIADAWPSGLAQAFWKRPAAVVALCIAGFLGLFTVSRTGAGAEGFYAVMPHGMMLAIFAPAFLLPLAALWISLRRHWSRSGGGSITVGSFIAGLKAAATMKNLSGGHGDGCNFEKGERFSPARRHAHQAVMWGFAMCFASTSVATLYHYGFGWPAPYAFLSMPKLLGVVGGVTLLAGCIGLAILKRKADPGLGRSSPVFLWLLASVSATGLALYAATGTAAVGWLLPLHLATVLTLFLLTPYSKMVHGAYRLMALVRKS